MIAKITRGSGFGGAVRYVLDGRKGLTPEHQPEIVGGNMAGRTSGELVREFSAVRWQRPDVQKPRIHALTTPYGTTLFGFETEPYSSFFAATRAS